MKSVGRLPGRNLRVWSIVRQIPRGKVAAYGQIARLAGLGAHARQVGYALHALPEGLPVPWHRVINARGEISFPRGSTQYTEQKSLLEAEGVMFRGGRIDLHTFGWKR